MCIVITGSSGFIGSALTIELLKQGHKVIGVDNHNNYYDPSLKQRRLNRYLNNSNFTHNQIDISDEKSLKLIFDKFKPKKVVNLAAQAGVRYSIEAPNEYIKSNVVGFMNILECCKIHQIEHLIYASTSSVYGANTKMPFSEHDSTNHPLSIYSSSKKSNELMAHSYSHLFNLPTTGLRFFTVYGPWGRPDMALFKFTKNILDEKSIDVYNYGNHTRDFTYIDDIVQGIIKVMDRPPSGSLEWNSDDPDPSSSKSPWKIYNIGNNKSVKLADYIHALEKSLGKKAKINYLPMQPGDVPDTYASVDNLQRQFNYKPNTSIIDGVSKFVKWYLDYYQK